MPGARRAAGRARRAAGDRRRRFKPASDDLNRCCARSAPRSAKTPLKRPTSWGSAMNDTGQRRRPVRARRRWRSSCARCRCPRSAHTDVLLRGRRRVGLRLRCAPGVQHAFVAGEHAGRARPRVRRHRRRGRARGDGLQGRRPRRQRDRGGHLRRLPDVPHRPLQPVPDAQGFRLRHQRRDGAVREGAGALPAPHSGFAAVRARLPRPSRTRSRTTRCASTRRSGPATSSSCSGPGRSACCARGWRRWRARIR